MVVPFIGFYIFLIPYAQFFQHVVALFQLGVRKYNRYSFALVQNKVISAVYGQFFHSVINLVLYGFDEFLALLEQIAFEAKALALQIAQFFLLVEQLVLSFFAQIVA